MTNLDSSKLKEIADDNFKIDENGKKVLPHGKNHREKGRNYLLRAISPFPTAFSKDLHSRHVDRNQGLLGKGFTLSLLMTAQEAFMDNVDLDQTAQNVQSDL